MTVPKLKLPILQATQIAVDSDGRLSPALLRALNDAFSQIGSALTAILAIPEIQDALNGLDMATQAAQLAADKANSAATSIARDAALQGSYITPDSVLTATPTTITIADHVRHYTDGTTANVTGGTVPASASGDTDYVSYQDVTRMGGAVQYVASTTQPTQTGDTHVVGAVLIPASGNANGGSGPMRPGFVAAKIAQDPGNES